MDGIDKLTLELLMNKQQYNKYLSIKDPSKYDEIQEYLNKIIKYSDTIMEITEEYIANNNKQNTHELDDAFHNYVKSCIRFIEMKNLETYECLNDNENRDTDDNTMFANFEPRSSFWGKGARKANE